MEISVATSLQVPRANEVTARARMALFTPRTFEGLRGELLRALW